MKQDKDILKSEMLLGQFMQEQRKKNISLITNHYKLQPNDAEDVYQDACLALFTNIQTGKLTELTAKLSTYFTQICVFQAINKIRDSKKNVEIDSIPEDLIRIHGLLDEGSDYTIGQQLAMVAMVKKMDEPCRTILWQFHYKNKSMKDIAPMVKFSSADSVKTKKSQCISQLKKTFDNRIKNLKRDGEE